MKVRILSTSDVHGNIYPTNFATQDNYSPFGYLKALSAINQIRQAHPDEIVLYIENGDFIEGAPMATYAHKTAASKHYDQLFARLTALAQPVAGVLGNHEFNYGLPYIEQVWRTADYPLLTANILKNGQPLFKPYTILEQQGLTIGIIGLTTQYIPHWEAEKNIAGLQFLPAYETAQKYVKQLRPQVDLLIIAYHGGFEADLQTGQATEPATGENEGYQLLTNLPGVDALITGHQHRQIAAVVNGVPTSQPGFRGETIGQLTLEVTNNQVTDADANLISVADFPAAPAGLELTKDWKSAVDAWLDQPLTTIKGGMLINNHLQARLHGHPYLELINQVQMQATGTDLACTSLFNDEIRGFDEEVTIRNVLNGYPYPNTLVVEKISGADLRQALERCASFFELDEHGHVIVAKEFLEPKEQLFNYDYYSGIDYCFDLRKPRGQRVSSLRYHDHEVSDSDQLKLALNQYRGGGGGEYPMFSSQKVSQSYEDDVQGLIINYLAAKPSHSIEQPHNLKIIF